MLAYLISASSTEININMRCIEMVKHKKAVEHFLKININMRCIEIQILLLVLVMYQD